LPESRPFFTRVESLRGLGALAVAGYHFSGWWVHGVALLPDYPWSNAGPFRTLARLAPHARAFGFNDVFLSLAVSSCESRCNMVPRSLRPPHFALLCLECFGSIRLLFLEL